LSPPASVSPSACGLRGPVCAPVCLPPGRRPACHVRTRSLPRQAQTRHGPSPTAPGGLEVLDSAQLLPPYRRCPHGQRGAQGPSGALHHRPAKRITNAADGLGTAAAWPIGEPSGQLQRLTRVQASAPAKARARGGGVPAIEFKCGRAPRVSLTAEPSTARPGPSPTAGLSDRNTPLLAHASRWDDGGGALLRAATSVDVCEEAELHFENTP
jgi:hypothetical protein